MRRAGSSSTGGASTRSARRVTSRMRRSRLRLRVDDPALLHYRSGAFYLARAAQAGVDGTARRHARRRRCRGRADSRRAAQGLRAQGARRAPDDVDDRLAASTRGGNGDRDRPCRTAGRGRPVEDRRGRHVLVRRRLTEPCDRAGRPQHHRSVHVPGPAGAAPARLRGQRSRHQRSVSGGLGRVGAHGEARAALRGGVRERSFRGAGGHRGARRLGPRATPAGDPASPDGEVSQPRRRGRGDCVSDAAGDPGGLRARPDPGNGALARVGRARERRGARGRLPRRPQRGARAGARGDRAPADDLRGAGHGAARAALPGCRGREGGACPPCRRRAAHACPGDQRRAGCRARAPPERAAVRGGHRGEGRCLRRDTRTPRALRRRSRVRHAARRDVDPRARARRRGEWLPADPGDPVPGIPPQRGGSAPRGGGDAAVLLATRIPERDGAPNRRLRLPAWLRRALPQRRRASVCCATSPAS